MKMQSAMRNVLVLSVFIIVLAPALAAAEGERQARNCLYYELGGNGILWTFNYERFVHDDISARVGAGYFWIGLPGVASASVFTLPVTVSYFGVRSGNHALELGGGAVLVHLSAESDIGGTETFSAGTAVGGTAIIGYRYLPRAGGWTFRAALTPLWGEGGTELWGGVAFGYLF